jgi:putative oxidoreductase
MSSVAYQRTENSLVPYGIALVRVVVGITFFMHGYQKFFEMGVGGVEGFFGMLGIPAPALAALAVSVVELAGGLALILGALTRVVGVLLAIDMIVALLVVHLPHGFYAPNNGIELVFVLGAAALGLALTGPGAMALDELLPFERRFRARERVVS